MRIFPILLLTLLPGLALAAEGTPGGEAAGKALAAAKTLHCVFRNAIETTWEEDRYDTRPRGGFSFTIEAISTARGNAKAVGRQGATHLEMIALPNVRHFLGFAAGGDLNVTSVHGQYAGRKGEFLASHSVHMTSEPPSTFQHYGTCQQAKDKT
jgi:hypothetical protein